MPTTELTTEQMIAEARQTKADYDKSVLILEERKSVFEQKTGVKINSLEELEEYHQKLSVELKQCSDFIEQEYNTMVASKADAEKRMENI